MSTRQQDPAGRRLAVARKKILLLSSVPALTLTMSMVAWSSACCSGSPCPSVRSTSVNTCNTVPQNQSVTTYNRKHQSLSSPMCT